MLFLFCTGLSTSSLAVLAGKFVVHHMNCQPPLHMASFFPIEGVATPVEEVSLQLLSLHAFLVRESLTGTSEVCKEFKRVLTAKDSVATVHFLEKTMRTGEFKSIDLLNFGQASKSLEELSVAELQSVKKLVSKTLVLAKPLHMLLAEGGDDRQKVDPETLKNKYYGTFTATPEEAVIQRGSCTCSSPHPETYANAERVQRRLIWDLISSPNTTLEEVYEKHMEEIRSRIKKNYSLESRAYVFLSPSGTDSEMIPTWLAWKRQHLSQDAKITNIIMADGEVGSGTKNASALRYFSPQVPHGNINIIPNTEISGVTPGFVNIMAIPARNSEKLPDSDYYENIESRVTQVLQQKIEVEGHVVVLHLVHFTKTGILLPNLDFLERAKQKYGEKLVAVIDACQARTDDSHIREWLNKGFLVLITGSKFFSGAPLSGATLIPISEADAFSSHQPTTENQDVPAGLGHFFSGYDMDRGLQYCRNVLPLWCNWGVLFRWETGLFEMQRFYALDAKRREEVTLAWVQHTSQILNKSKRCLLMEQHERSDYLGASVISIKVRKNSNQEIFYVHDELREIHKSLTQDLSGKLNLDPESEQILKQRVVIGQPVLIDQEEQTSVLRIALGAPYITKMITDATNISKYFMQDEVVVAKIDLIAQFFAKLVNT